MIATDSFKYVTEYLPKDTEKFVPPGPDSDSLGLAQLFDLKNDPGETRNLAYRRDHQATVSALKARLMQHEGRLSRTVLTDTGARRTIGKYSAYIKSRHYPRMYQVD